MTNGVKIVQCRVCGAVAEVNAETHVVNFGEVERCKSKPIENCRNLKRAIEQARTLQ